ncbi:MAG: hypothetical protein Kow0089_00480 [Desulfobulbaceae bacterium]
MVVRIPLKLFAKRAGLTGLITLLAAVLLAASLCQAQEYDSIKIYPENVGVFLKQGSQQFVAFGIKAGQAPVNITKKVGWKSSDPSIVTIDDNGLATIVDGVTHGQVKITATYPKSGGSAMGAVNSLLLSKIRVTALADGTGSGDVSSDVGGISYTYNTENRGSTTPLTAGDTVVLTATAATGSTVSWDDCATNGGTVGGDTSSATCTFASIDGDRFATATFTLDQHTVTATASGTGSGTMSSDVGGISYTYPTDATGTTTPLDYGSTVVVTATASTGSTVSWDDCAANGGTEGGTSTAATCTFSALDGDKTINATFTLDQHTVTVNAAGTGEGNVTSSVGGISYSYQSTSTGTTSPLDYGTSITILAGGTNGSTAAFNDCDTAGGTVSGNGTVAASCEFSSLDGDKTITATFTAP